MLGKNEKRDEIRRALDRKTAHTKIEMTKGNWREIEKREISK